MHDSFDGAAAMHAASFAAMIGALMGVFPAFAAFLACVYYMIMIWQSPTVQGFRAWIRSKLKAKPPAASNSSASDGS